MCRADLFIATVPLENKFFEIGFVRNTYVQYLVAMRGGDTWTTSYPNSSSIAPSIGMLAC